MKLGKIIKTMIKWAPVIYPIVKKMRDEKKATHATVSRK